MAQPMRLATRLADQQLRQRGIQGDIGVISAIDLEEGLLQITFEECIVD
jgi:exodeoxyribonuclease V alpha subunit